MGANVIVGMSGGVDSSVAAYLLKKQGYNVTGVTMKIWDGESEQPAIDAAKVAKELGIEHIVIDFREDFKRYVIDYFVKEYTLGRTPNPCVVCNRYVKWEALLSKISDLGADYIATGHYATIRELDNKRRTVSCSVNMAKDQTYALYNLTQEQLAKTIMPVGEYSKDEIRKIAAEIGIAVAYKPDSMEICFIPDNDYASYIKKYSGYEAVPGNFVDLEGNIIGKHKGIIHYTVGQRKGLGLAMGYPVFVVAIKPDTNEVVVGENKDVFRTSLYANKVNFMGMEPAVKGAEFRATAKIRYSHNGADCIVKMVDDDLMECVFDEPQRAITPGQSVVLYKEDYVLGGGVII